MQFTLCRYSLLPGRFDATRRYRYILALLAVDGAVCCYSLLPLLAIAATRCCRNVLALLAVAGAVPCNDFFQRREHDRRNSSAYQSGDELRIGKQEGDDRSLFFRQS